VSLSLTCGNVDNENGGGCTGGQAKGDTGARHQGGCQAGEGAARNMWGRHDEQHDSSQDVWHNDLEEVAVRCPQPVDPEILCLNILLRFELHLAPRATVSHIYLLCGRE
jgi:hypothetical protein